MRQRRRKLEPIPLKTSMSPETLVYRLALDKIFREHNITQLM